MENNKRILSTIKEFCFAWFKQRNLLEAIQYLSEDVSFVGIGEGETIQGLCEFKKYIKQNMEENKSSFKIEFITEQENYITADTGIGILEFYIKSDNYKLHIYGTFTLTKEKRWMIRHLHLAVPVIQQEIKEHDSFTLKKHISDTRHELLSSSIAGGLIGTYLEENFPFYYINDKMLSYLGYESEEEFVTDINGYISNCIHADDWEKVNQTIYEQLEKQGQYIVEYRMKKKNGNYIYVQDMGKTITTEDKRKAVLSVCIDISEQKFEKQQNESLIKAMNGGVIICKVWDKNYIPIYLSSGIGSITGYTKKEVKEIISNDIQLLIYPQDREKFLSIVQRAIKSEESIEEIYRVRHKQGQYIWVTSMIQKSGEEDGIPILHCIFTSVSNQFELQSNILNETDTGIYVIDPQTYELYLTNEAGFRIMEIPACDYAGKKCFEVFSECTVPCEYCRIHLEDEEPKEMYIPKLDKIITITIKHSNWMGKNVIIEYLNDITQQKRIEKDLKLGEEKLKTAILHAGIEFWEYDIKHDRAYLSGFSKETDQTPSVIENFPEYYLSLKIIHPDDEENYRKLHKSLKDGVKEAMLEYRVKKMNGEYCWLLAHYTNHFDKKGQPAIAFATAEYIDRYKELEEQFTIAARLTGIRVWTLDIPTKTTYFNDNDAKNLGIKKTISCNTKEELRELDIVHPDDIQKVWDNIGKIFCGSDNISFQIRTKIGSQYRWNRVSYTVIKSKGKIPVKAIGSSIDIHEHVLLEQRFEEELKYSAGLQDQNLINRVQCNITKGTIELYVSNENLSATNIEKNYQNSLEKLILSVVEEEKQKEIRHLLNRENIIESYTKGTNYYTIDYQKKLINGAVFWANTIVRVYQNPATNDIMSFMYTYNIDEKKTAEAIVERVVDTNFEYLTLFNIITGIVEKTIDKSGVDVKPEEGYLYEDVVEKGFCKLLLVEEKEEYLPMFKIKTIVKRLNENGTYSISTDIFDPIIQEKRHKLWVFNWFDKQHTKVLCSRSDITEVYCQEQHQKEVLSAALTAAKQANAAKTDFLSRMSHEIRTPMNAIIGMTAIAAKLVGDNKQISDCISKIGISSRFLLSLINDILDMSRIESGKMLLKNEKIPFKEFITGINTICHTQAAAKDVEYECVIDPMIDDYYIGDAMKLQQVLVNILGNAVKFTSSGGKVSFCISQRKRSKNDALLRFVIHDTGIGMEEEFLPHLFEPFEQESNNSAVGFGGTGLGLAISKNIVDLMDGKIQVCSIKGVGTEFTVDVKLGITEEEKQRYLRKQHAYNFSHLKTLVVDDDITVCESAILTLKEIGIIGEWVDSGRQAVDRIKKMWKKQQYYDMILIDWKMPEMDGIETSRRIREIVGSDVTIIIMTAYDGYSIEQEAKAVGVNLLMSKPMFKSNLISAFSKILEQKEEEKEQIEPLIREYNFTGKRILLVEDHPINLEIAQVILESVGFEVETAENGLRAIEMFSKTTNGYYNAVLMDIRMPIMDGLQASTNIRHLSNKDAKTIPIIAMTADAFDEDADKCKIAGMNFHLSKPIDPPRLYQTLYNFIYQEENEEL